MQTPSFRLRLPPGTDQVTELLDALEAFAEEVALPPALGARLALVAEELASNVAKYAEGATWFELRADVTPSGVVLEFDDDGPEFNPLNTAPPDPAAALDAREIGGLGLHLVRSMTREALYRHHDGGNRLRCLLPAAA